MGVKEEWRQRGIDASLARDKRPTDFRVGHQIFGCLKSIHERSIETLEKRWRISPGWNPENNSSTSFAGKTYILSKSIFA
jgi:hypothetical protein